MAYDDAAAAGENEPPRRRRGKSTRELIAAIETLSSERDGLVEKLTARRRELESECYLALGEALFLRRRDEDAAPLYGNIAASLGSRLRRKLDELALLPADLE